MCVLSDASVSDEVVQNDVDSPDAFYDIGCFECNSAAPGGDGPLNTTLPPDDPVIVTPVCTTETNLDVSEFSICNFVGILDYGPTVVDEPTETSVRDCAVQCLAKSSCKSFAFDASSSNCLLLAEDIASSGPSGGASDYLFNDKDCCATVFVNPSENDTFLIGD